MAARNNIISRTISIILFLIYLICLSYFLFFAEGFGRGRNEYSYNLVLFHEIKRFLFHYEQLGWKIVVLNLAGNVVAFMPFGFFVPRILSRKVNFFKIFIMSFGFSLGVELIQLVTKLGSFDVDDILLNTIGGVLGYFVYKLTVIGKEN